MNGIEQVNKLLQWVIEKLAVKEYNLNLLNGWTNHGGDNAPIKATIIGNEMAVTGTLSSGTIAKNTKLFDFPEGYAATYNCYGRLTRFWNPLQEHLVRVYPNGTAAHIDNNYDLLASGTYFLDIKVPIKYVGGGTT
ncbi:hypothetical protein [Anaerovorax odorimutans]|nr:hypothetical protein [Anaerovorax odorimutans]